MKKIFRALLVVVIGVFVVTSLTLKADTPKIEKVDGASIRTGTLERAQGLRFYAKLSEDVLGSEHGFYLVFGETTVGQLETAIAAAAGGDVYLNGKVVYQITIAGVSNKNEFSVVLTGIPDKGYFDKVSVIAYVVVDEVVEYALPTSRNVAEVALKMANDGEPIEEVLDVVAVKKKYALNAFGQYELSSGLLELNNFNIRDEFFKDWNAKFGTELDGLDAAKFVANSKVGFEDAIGANKNLSNGNIYKFFNDDNLKDKWAWLLEFIIDQCGITHASRQAIAIQGDGTNEDYLVYHADHFTYSVSNFFNQEHKTSFSTAINFTQLNRYTNDKGVQVHNDSLYVDFNKYQFYSVGETMIVQEAPAIVGYNFDYYLVDENELEVGQSYIVGDDALFNLVYSPINYVVRFYDGETELTELQTTYTIEASKTLPEYVKDGFVFEGWHDNPGLSGLPISSIPKASTGAKTFYASTVSSEGSGNITYILDGGGIYKYTSREEMVADFMTDFNAYFSTKPDIEASGFQAGTYLWNVYTIFSDATYGSKWMWMRTYVIQVANDQSHASAAELTNNNDGFWRSTIDSFLNSTVRPGWPATADYTNEPAKNGFWSNLAIPYPEVYEYGFELTLPIPFKAGKTFGGWYLDVGFETPITKISEESTGDVTLYAKWD